MFQPTDIALLCETSWEVCNKVGGIYTVLSTKAKCLTDILPGRVVFIGPDFEDAERPDFIPEAMVLDKVEEAVQLPYGLRIRAGYWNVPGQPYAILVDFHPLMSHLDEFYATMWERYQVDSLHAYGDYDESCAFAVASAMVMAALGKHLGKKAAQCIGHFDEWTTGMGLLWLQINAPEWATVFTTHATSIGRSICGNGKDLYKYFAGYNGDQMAEQLNMQSKHSLEKSAAHAADCFTTVSEVTARECTQLLDITPQVITPNGFEPAITLAVKRTARSQGRRRLLAVAKEVTGREFGKDTLIIATAGRNEFRNKGLDMFIDAVNSLRADEKIANREVLALILVPAWVKEPDTQHIFDFMTHRLYNEDSDAVLCKLRAIGENAGRNVSVIYCPCYLDGTDGIINIPYYSLLPALDLTVFPSYYEPWGYTPLESVAFGVPTVTTDKSGFGQWVKSHAGESFADTGVEVVKRDDDNYHQAVWAIERIIALMTECNDSCRRKLRAAAKSTASKADWKIFITDYEQAFETALKKAEQRCAR